MNQGKYDPNSASIAQDLGNSLAHETARLGNKITDKMLAVPPTIKIPMGQRLNVFVEQDLSLWLVGHIDGEDWRMVNMK